MRWRRIRDDLLMMAAVAVAYLLAVAACEGVARVVCGV